MPTRDEVQALLVHCRKTGEPMAFFGRSGRVAASMVRAGDLRIVERRPPLGHRYVVMTDAGRAKLAQMQEGE